MILLRRILFYLFCALYFIICPMTVMYALGYLFRPGGEQTFVKTGMIYLSTVPRGASVYVEGRRFKRRTPAALPRLLPGEYAVSLRLKGHQSWDATIPVEEEQASVLENILILPMDWQPAVLVRGPFEDLIEIPKTKFLILRKGDTLDSLFVYDWKTDKATTLFPSDFQFPQNKIQSLRVIPGSDRVLIGLMSGNEFKLLWVDLTSQEVTMISPPPSFGRKSTDIQWESSGERELYLLDEGRVDKLDLNTGAFQPAWLTGLRGISAGKHGLYALKQDATFHRLHRDGSTDKIFLKDADLGASIFGATDEFDIHVLAREFIVFMGKHGQLITSRFPYHFVKEGVRGFAYEEEKESLLVWKSKQLGVLHFSSPGWREEKVFERGPELVWVYQDGKEIEQAYWLYNNSHILFRDRNKVALIELETYGKPHFHAVTKVKDKSDVFYSDDSGKLYYLDAETSDLESIEILPKREILPLPFPERKEKKRPNTIQTL